MKVHELKYSNRNTYLIEGENGRLLFDTGWAGTFPSFCREMGELHISIQTINYIVISHFHPDHMGIAQEIADHGSVIAIADVQRDFIHNADSISLYLDDGSLFVGDLNPLYELELHKGTQIEESWNRLLPLKPVTVYYGHAKKALLQ